jgi:hypothetical protein
VTLSTVYLLLKSPLGANKEMVVALPAVDRWNGAVEFSSPEPGQYTVHYKVEAVAGYI